MYIHRVPSELVTCREMEGEDWLVEACKYCVKVPSDKIHAWARYAMCPLVSSQDGKEVHSEVHLIKFYIVRNHNICSFKII